MGLIEYSWFMFILWGLHAREASRSETVQKSPILVEHTNNVNESINVQDVYSRQKPCCVAEDPALLVYTCCDWILLGHHHEIDH